MITSREFIDVCEGRAGRILPYEILTDAMATMRIRFKSRVVNGHRLWCYLDAFDVRRLVEFLGIDLSINGMRRL